MDLLDLVRYQCANVAKQASHVHINHRLIPEYALSLLPILGTKPKLDPTCHYVNHEQESIAFIIILNSINFGSGYFPHLRKRDGRSGYYTIASSLFDLFAQGNALTACQLEKMTTIQCAKIFGQDMNDPVVAELMSHFSEAMSELGSYVLNNYDGSFVELAKAADHSVSLLIDILRQMPLFVDQVRYKNMDVPFYKRAQITASDLSIAFDGKGLGYFHDLDRLTIFADNMVPHVLRVDGVLTYKNDLLERILREELLPAGSREEIEIRACAVHAAELIKEALNDAGKKVISQQLDNVLWNKGQNPKYKQIPRHRTRTTNY